MILIHRICLLLVASAASIATCPSWLCGDEPLSRRIDRAITDAHVGPLSPLANDYEFARRVHLDFVGRSPSIDEVRSFVTDTDPEKRRELIDRLLASTEFDKYFARALDITLMERRGGARISQTQWMKFLRDAVSQQWPLDRIVQQVIRADGKDGSRGAAKFLIEREVEPNALTRDIGRIFFGRDLQCAQCHDHPNIADYTQGEYYGIYAFVDRSYLFEDPKDNKKSYVGEKADGDPQFKSVFEPDADDSTATPSLLSGLTLEIEPPLGSDDAYVVPPSKSAAAVPTFSRRAQLARLITHPANQHFARNMANRLWAHLMGRGLVHPLDFHHSDNPPTHPALLQMLADEFAASGFDYRELLRQIAQSDAYQRSIDMPEELPTSLADLEAQQAELKQSLANLNKPSDSQLGEYQQDLERRRQRLAEADAAIAELTGESAAIDANRAELEKSLAAANPG